MERNRDFRAATVSAGNGLTRRRQRIITLKDSTEEDRDIELQETVRLRDRERLQKKDRDREFPKRRKVESYAVQQRSGGGGGGGESYRENDSTDASDEEYREEEDDARIHYLNRMNQPSPSSSSFSNNRRNFRSLRSSPMLRNAVDEMIGVPIPRRARSTSTKRLHEYSNSGSGRLGEDLSRRVFSPSPATASLVSAGGASSSSSGAFLKKKMKSVEPRTSALTSSSNSRPPSVIQDDIEIEVVEALFDLMKQSQSLSQSCKRQERLDKNDKNTADEGLTKSVEDDIHTISVRNKHSIKVDAETNMVDSIEEFENEERIEIEKFPDDSVLEIADGILDKEKVVTPKESVSPSSVKVNAGEIQDPTVTKANYAAIVVETKKETKLEIDLMAPPPLPSSPEKDVSVDLSSLPKFMARDVQKSETISKDGPLAVTIRPKEEERGAISSNQSPNFNLEKHHHDTSSVRDGSKQLQWGPKEQKIQIQTSLLPYPISMSGWPGALPHPGYMPHLQAVLPMDGARFPTAMQPPKFKLSQPRPKRSATHQYIACNIHYHQQLITKSLWSEPTGAATFYGTKPLNPNSIPPTQRLIPGNPLLGDYQGRQNCATISGGRGKDKGSEVPTAINATKSKELVVQQGPLQSSANNFLHGPAFVFPIVHHQTTLTSPAKPTGQPQSASAVGSLSLPSNSAGGPSVHLSMPGEAAAMTINNLKLPSNEVAPYMAVLQKKNSQIPPSMNIAMPQLKGGTQGPTMPLFNSSFYSSPMFSVSQSQQLLSLPHTPSLSGTKNNDNNFPTLATVNSQQTEKQQVPPSLLSSKFDIEIGRKGSAPLGDGLAPHYVKPNNGQTYSFPVQPMNFAIIPPGPIGAAAAVGNKHGDIQQLGSKGRAELIPQSFALSFGSNASTGPPLNFSSMAQNSAIFQMLPDMSWNGYQMAQQKSFQTSEGKSAVGSTKMDDGLNGNLGKSQTSGGQSSKSGSTDISALSMMGTSMVDGLARAVNVVPSSSSANQQPFPSSSVAQTSGVSVILPNLHHHHHHQQQQQQQQAIQLQKHHMQQMQLTGTAQLKASSTANGMSGSFLPSSFQSNHPIFSQVSVQTDNSSYSSHCQNLPRTTAPEGSPQSAKSNVLNIPQGRSSQGHTHISFGSSLVSAASFQGQQVVTNNQPALAVGLSSNSSVSKNTGISQRTASHISNAGSTISALPSQQTEASQNGPSQKSSPACGRNVPSILSTCPSHLSELKY